MAGVGDLLALFRCVSVRYRFSTDVMKPSLMGAIGRVYSSLEVRRGCAVRCSLVVGSAVLSRCVGLHERCGPACG